KNGAYKNMANFLQRVPMGLEQIRILIRIGALRFTGKDKQRLLWEAMLYVNQAKTKRPAEALFESEPKEFPLPVLQRHAIEDAFDEIELLGFPLCDPFTLLAINERGTVTAKQLLEKVGNHVHIVGYMVTVKDTRTKTKAAMSFGTFYDCHGEVFDTVHFPNIAQRFPLRGRGFYSIKGKVVEDFGVTMIEVTWLDKLPMINKRAE